MLIGSRPSVCCDTSRELCIILLRSRETATLTLFVFKMPPMVTDLIVGLGLDILF